MSQAVPSPTVQKKVYKRWWFRLIAIIAALLIVAIIAAYAFFIAPYHIYADQNVDLPENSAEFVLIPGAGHPAASYDKVTELLEDDGQTVHALTLPGVGDRADELTPETGLQTQIDDVVAYFQDNDLHDIVLVGHSFGGMVITGVADQIPDRIERIVYLDAIHPKDGQNLIEAQPLVKYVPAVSEPLTIDGVEVNLYPDDDTIAFLGLTEPDDVAWAKSHLTPHPWKTFTDTLHLANPNIIRDVPVTDIYTRTTIWGLSIFGLVTGDEKANAWVIPTGHDLMITESELVADALLNAASHP